MEGDLISQCQRLKINDTESGVVTVDELCDEENTDQVSLVLVGRVVTDCNFNVEASKRTMTQSWAISKKLVLRMIDPNRFIFQLFRWKDKEKVLEARPWSFDNHLVVLSEIFGHEQQLEVSLNHSPFWIRIKDLPFNCRSNKLCKAIASNLGLLLDVEDDGVRLDNYRWF